MSKRSQIHEHLQKLNEIGDIMRAMKNVSLMEVHKLARILEHQQRVMVGIAAATMDFVRHYATSLSRMESATTTHVVVLGSERGFCGDYNEAVAAALQRFPANPSTRVYAVGSRLRPRLEVHGAAVRFFEGANTVEEVQAVIDALMRELARPSAAGVDPLALVVLCHQDGRDEVVAERVSALPARGPEKPCEPYPPLLNVPVPVVHDQLLRHHLWAQMHQLFYSALLAEHRFRLQHMERALQRMDEKIDALRRHQNILRQEEITEEIEVIMLNGDAEHTRHRGKRSLRWQ